MESTKGRILCVDGNTPDVDTLLDLQGYELILARGVAEALTEIAEGQFDLILLDWVFEDGTGIDLCKSLRSAGAAAPVLFYSGDGNGEKTDIEAAMRAGAQGLLIRPVDSADLLRSLSGFLGNSGINDQPDTA